MSPEAQGDTLNLAFLKPQIRRTMAPRNAAYSSVDEKDFANVDLAPISPTRTNNTDDYAKFRNDRILSVQNRAWRPPQTAKPLPSSTRRAVFGIRRGQLVVRVLQLAGSAGLLATLILLGNIPSVESYIVRAPPSADIATSAYAVYHLIQSARARSPSTSSSYHFFACVIDAGLIAFYVFIAIVAHAQIGLGAGDPTRWTSSVANGTATGTLILATWFGAIIIGALHLVSFAVSVYLSVTFRKIAHLPPDMNPLEGNLTARPSGSIRRPRSNMSNISNGNDRPLSSLPRPMSFFGTRRNNNRNYSPMNPAFTTSRTNLTVPSGLDIFKPLPAAPRSSSPNRKITPRAETPPPLDDDLNPILRVPSLISSSSVYTNSIKSPIMAHDSPHLHALVPAIPRKSSKRIRSDQQADNWFVQDDNALLSQRYYAKDPQVDPATGTNFSFGILPSQQQKYAPVYDDDDDDTTINANDTVRVRRALAPRIPSFMNPLEMNPPTPRGSRLNLRQPDNHQHHSIAEEDAEALRPYTPPPPRSKLRSHGYGGLERIHTSTSTSTSKEHLSHDLGVNKPDWEIEIARPDSGIDRMSPGGARVVSRTGVDIGEARLGYYDDDEVEEEEGQQQQRTRGQGLRERNVSGKVVEEGRGGW